MLYFIPKRLSGEGITGDMYFVDGQIDQDISCDVMKGFNKTDINITLEDLETGERHYKTCKEVFWKYYVEEE